MHPTDENSNQESQRDNPSYVVANYFQKFQIMLSSTAKTGGGTKS